MSLKIAVDVNKLSFIVFKALQYHEKSAEALRKKAARKGLSIGKQCQFNGAAQYHEQEAQAMNEFYREISRL